MPRQRVASAECSSSSRRVCSSIDSSSSIPSQAAMHLDHVGRREARVDVGRQRVERRDDRVEHGLERADEAHREVVLAEHGRQRRRACSRARRPAGGPGSRGPSGARSMLKRRRRVANVVARVGIGRHAHAPTCSALTTCWRRGDQLVGLERQEAAHRLRLLLAGDEVGLVHTQDLDEVDALHGVHDAVQLALVERAAELPAGADALERAADERVEVGVERLRDVALDAREVGAAARPAR